jgi:hypothetical protein
VKAREQREGCTLCDRVALILSLTNAFHEEGPRLKEIFLTSESRPRRLSLSVPARKSTHGSKLSLEILPIPAAAACARFCVMTDESISRRAARV